VTEGTGTPRFLALDSWRGICALFVAAHHIETQGWLFWQPLVRDAWLFVDFFFVLSGFVIAHAYSERLTTATATRIFILRRFARLWPLHAAVLAAMIALELLRLLASGGAHDAHVPFTGEHAPAAILSNFLLLQAFGLHDGETWNGPAWSISVEFYTYILFALFCVALRSGRARALGAIVLAVAAASALAAFSEHGMRDTYQWPIFRCLFGFFSGTLAYALFRSGRTHALAGTPAEFLAVAAVIAFITFAPGRGALAFLAPPLFAGAIIVFAAEKGFFSRQLAGPLPLALGRWSYSIYMCHMLVISLAFGVLHGADLVMGTSWLHRSGEAVRIDSGSASGNDALMLLILASVVLVSAATYRMIEIPGRRFFKRDQ
jgi:peptidoglycan/LPS O-acetylase OafA/YrhL